MTNVGVRGFKEKGNTMPKSYGRNERIGASLRREAARILASEIKDPRVKLATVTEVNVAPDLRNATIFVSFLDDDDKTVKEAMQVLKKASGYVRSTMAARLKMRYMPNIEFEFDSLVKDGMKLDALIAKGLGPKDEEGRLADVTDDDYADEDAEIDSDDADNDSDEYDASDDDDTDTAEDGDASAEDVETLAAQENNSAKDKADK